MVVENLVGSMAGSGLAVREIRAGVGLEGAEGGDQAVEHAGAEGEEMELALTAYLDESGSFELFDVMGDGGSGDGQGCTNIRAAHRTAGRGDTLQELETARVGKGLENGGAASAGKML